MNLLPAPLKTWWQTRAPRERQFLSGLAIFLLCALLIQGLWSAHQARTRLRQQVPQLRMQLETLKRQAGDIRTLQAQAITPPPATATLQETAATLLRNTGLEFNPQQLQAEGPRLLRLRADLPFDRWIEATATLQRSAQLRLLRARVDLLEGSPGNARIDAQFALPDLN